MRFRWRKAVRVADIPPLIWANLHWRDRALLLLLDDFEEGRCEAWEFLTRYEVLRADDRERTSDGASR